MAGKLVTIATFDLAGQAHIAKNALEAVGIKSVLADEQTVAMDWLLSNAIGGIKVQVLEEDAERAVAALEESLGSDEPVDEEMMAAEAEAAEKEDLDEPSDPAAPPADAPPTAPGTVSEEVVGAPIRTRRLRPPLPPRRVLRSGRSSAVVLRNLSVSQRRVRTRNSEPRQSKQVARRRSPPRPRLLHGDLPDLAFQGSVPLSLTAIAAQHPDDTIVALSSAAGPGARAIVRVSGPETRAVVERVFVANQPNPPTSFPPREGGLPRGVASSFPAPLTLSDVHSPLPAMLYFFPGPRSYTGQDLAELHTVGSPPLVERLVADLLNAGARPAQPGEFTLRAFLAGKKDLPQAEAVHAVIEAGTDADLQSALAQLAGGVTQPLHALRDDLLNLLADLEAALDFADEDIEFVGKSETLARINAALEQLTALQRQLDDRTVSGRPIRVALVGLPNAGKSSLFNALAGSDALVSPIPGTTRDYLTKRLDLAGVPVELIDTAGWQDSDRHDRGAGPATRS